MSDTVISVENLSKYYRLGLIGGGTLQDDLARKWAKLRGKPDPLLKIGQKDHGNVEGEFIWALRDINLKVKQGDILGIIGKNGAGKTTLLKILGKITAPTAGRAILNGRLGCLIAVGTGFHPELTGRENIYLNGAILGMKKHEVDRKFDEIVDFSGVEKFIDTPIKRYSSGMNVRLGFAVAAHLDPEILLVDEVLAVGDASFQKKCIGKMSSVAKEGRTILFVSHQMQAITNLCNRAILLDRGKIIKRGNTKDVVDVYLNEKSTGDVISVSSREDRQGNGSLKIIDTWIENHQKNKVNQVQTGSTITICAKYHVVKNNEIKNLNVAFALNTIQNIQISDLSNETTGIDLDFPDYDTGIIACTIEKLPVNVGIYTYNIMVRDQNRDIIDYIQEAGRFDVIEGDYFGTGKITLSDRLIMMEHHWEIEPSGKISEC